VLANETALQGSVERRRQARGWVPLENGSRRPNAGCGGAHSRVVKSSQVKSSQVKSSGCLLFMYRPDLT
jgi:hypothetical protein